MLHVVWRGPPAQTMSRKKKATTLLLRHTVTESWQKAGLQPRKGRDLTKIPESTKDHKRGLSSTHTTSWFCCSTTKQLRQTAVDPGTPGHSGSSKFRGTIEGLCPFAAETGQSVPAHDVNSLPLDNMFRVVNVIQQIMTQFTCAV
jgi:hypothetical protein